ncbi:MAG: Na+/H+ antiporter NhaA [Bacteroidota bacterium]|jgi:Na+:H+ antiporter, NhaA family|nr:Na+/H+ antiporter NhaA [Bacteroidota bacterium]
MKRLIKKAINPLIFFISDSRSTGILLLFCTAISLVLSNTIGEGYRAIWDSPIHYGLGIALPHSALKWINDFLMAIFFLFAGMEIKRELVDGELSGFKKAILPFGAALGGMIVPALIFISFNGHSGFVHGWGIPTATDIAFSLGIASLLGKRVPASLKIFLMALAIIDDLGAIVVIALFYGSSINWLVLLLGAFVYGLLWLCNIRKIKPGIIQIVLSLILWYIIFNSGIEASISGVLVAFAMPVNSLPNLENAIHKVVNFMILPLFVLANTAILIPADIVGALHSPISIGIIMGLVIGKPVGIFLFSKIMIRLKIAKLPLNTNLKQLIGVGSLAGIGFTMSIFTATLAFSAEEYRDIAKISVLLSLVLSIVLSTIYFMIIEQKVSIKPLVRKPPIRRISPEIAIG